MGRRLKKLGEIVKRVMAKGAYETVYPSLESKYDTNVENFKRRRALPPLSRLDAESRSFFERVLNVKKIKELDFFHDGRTKNR